jgi:hypothetical protein
MTKTRLLLAGLLTGAVAVGTACKTDTSTTTPGTQPTMPTSADDAGTGGTGFDTPQSAPLPDDGIREREPDVHNTPIDEPGTGGSGLEPHDMDRPDAMGDDTADKPLNKPPHIDSSVHDDSMSEDTAPMQKQ